MLSHEIVFARLQALNQSSISDVNFPARFEICISTCLVFLDLPDIASLTLACKRLRSAVVQYPPAWYRLCDRLAFLLPFKLEDDYGTHDADWHDHTTDQFQWDKLLKEFHTESNDPKRHGSLEEQLMPTFLLPLDMNPAVACIVPENKGIRKFFTLQCLCKLLFCKEYSNLDSIERCVNFLQATAGNTSKQLTALVLHYLSRSTLAIPHHMLKLSELIPLVAKVVAEAEGRCEDASDALPSKIVMLIETSIHYSGDHLRAAAVSACGKLFSKELITRVLKDVWREENEQSYFSEVGRMCEQALMEVRSPLVLPRLLFNVFRAPDELVEFELPFEGMKEEVNCQSYQKVKLLESFNQMNHLVDAMGGDLCIIAHLRKLYDIDDKNNEKKKCVVIRCGENKEEQYAKKTALSHNVGKNGNIETEEHVLELLCVLQETKVPAWVRCWTMWHLGNEFFFLFSFLISFSPPLCIFFLLFFAFSFVFVLISSRLLAFLCFSFITSFVGRPHIINLFIQHTSLAELVLQNLIHVICSPVICDQKCKCSRCQWNMSRWALRVIVQLMKAKCLSTTRVKTFILTALEVDNSALNSFKHSKPTPIMMQNSQTETLLNLKLEAQLWLVWVLLESKIVDLKQASNILALLNNPLYQSIHRL